MLPSAGVSRAQLECALRETQSTGAEDLYLLPLLLFVDAKRREKKSTWLAKEAAARSLSLAPMMASMAHRLYY